MDNRERGRRDASLGFGMNVQLMNRLASSVVDEPNQPKPETPEQQQPDRDLKNPVSTTLSQSAPAIPNWILATASASIPVFEEQNGAESTGSIEEGTRLRLFLPIVTEADDQWATVQFVSGELGELTTGWAKVATPSCFLVNNLSV